MNDKQLIKQIAELISKEGGTIYYVGGMIRDEFIDKSNKDIDVEIHNISLEKVKNILSRFGDVDLIGSSFGIYKIKGIDIDFAFPRKENNVGKNHTDFEVSIDPFMGTFEASKRRDFTMNSIMKDVITGEIVDHFNGQNDIKNKIIKYVNKETFVEDPLRVLRAAQFSSRFNFKIDNDILKLARTLNYKNLSRERIVTEFDKLMQSSYSNVGLQFLKEAHVLSQVLPSLLDENFDNKLNAISDLKSKELKYAILFNDLSEKSLNEVYNLFHSNVFEAKIQEVNLYSKFVPSLHLMSNYEKRKFLFEVGDVDLLIDVNIFTNKLNNKINVNQLLIDVSNESKTILREVQGRHLLNLGFKPSPKFKDILDYALDFQLKGHSFNEIILEITNKFSN